MSVMGDSSVNLDSKRYIVTESNEDDENLSVELATEPTFEIESISLTGEITITFSDPMLVPEDPNRLKEIGYQFEGSKVSNLQVIIDPIEG